MLFDYGSDSRVTSKSVKKNVYKQKDIYLMGEYIEQMETVCLAGHVAAQKYAPFFETANTFSIVRDPVKQVYSHYIHHCQLSSYEGTLEEFVKSSRFRDRQSKMLSGRELELYGFIGINERYEESLQIINSLCSLSIPLLKLNQTKKRSSMLYKLSKTNHSITDFPELTPQQEQFIKEYNTRDIALYEKSCKLLNERLRIINSGKPYTNCCVSSVKSGRVTGWAYRSGTDSPVNVDIYINDNLEGSVKCSELSINLTKHNAPRKGYIGFKYSIQKPIQEKDIVKYIISDTGQEILV